MDLSNINALLKDYVGTSDGKKQVAEVAYTNQEIKDAAFELAKSIQSAYLDSLSTSNAPLGMPTIRVQTDKETGFIEAVLSYSDNVLRRPSLYADKAYRRPINKRGVYDIVGLLSNGYQHTSKPVYGYWKGYGFTRGLRSRKADPFISKAIADFSRRYGVEVHYPSEWGGDN